VATWAFQMFKYHPVPDVLDVGLFKRLFFLCKLCLCVYECAHASESDRHIGTFSGSHLLSFFEAGSLTLSQGLITLAGLADQ
jgi:hypothetical protein